MKSEALTHHVTDIRPLHKCLYCAEMVLAEATLCRFCGKESPAIAYSQAPRTKYSLNDWVIEFAALAFLAIIACILNICSNTSDKAKTDATINVSTENSTKHGTG